MTPNPLKCAVDCAARADAIRIGKSRTSRNVCESNAETEHELGLNRQCVIVSDSCTVRPVPLNVPVTVIVAVVAGFGKMGAGLLD